MTGERSETSVPAGKVKQVISYRVGVKHLAKLLLKLALQGTLEHDDIERLKEISRGR